MSNNNKKIRPEDIELIFDEQPRSEVEKAEAEYEEALQNAIDGKFKGDATEVWHYTVRSGIGADGAGAMIPKKVMVSREMYFTLQSLDNSVRIQRDKENGTYRESF